MTAILKRAVPFVLTFVSGILGFAIISQLFFEKSSVPASQNLEIGHGQGSGYGHGSGWGDSRSATAPVASSDGLQILSKPKALYTDDARENDIQGTVRLKITLLASGEVGTITPMSTLPYGLTEQAIEAARKIKFKPKKVNGQPVSVVVTFEYGFNIY
ncbi:MAG: energy transducer TonB [Pyrinomonadaceae bacterium]